MIWIQEWEKSQFSPDDFSQSAGGLKLKSQTQVSFELLRMRNGISSTIKLLVKVLFQIFEKHSILF